MEEAAKREVEPFYVRDCAQVAIAAGYSAQNLREFRDCLKAAPEGSIYHHFWGRLLQPRFDEPEYSNDFASWASHGLHDRALAERLSIVDPTDFDNIEELRQEVVDIVEERLDESERVPWAKTGESFHFVRAQIVIFNTNIIIAAPPDLPGAIKAMSAGSIFYHFVDARRRPPKKADDFSAWLAGFGDKYQKLQAAISNIDPYFSSLEETRHRILGIMRDFFGGV